MDPYIAVLAGFGAVVLMTAWLPLLLKELPLSLPIICVCFGIALFLLPVPGLRPAPYDHLEFTERVTELVVIVALFGAGLKLERPLRWQEWRVTARLLGITMILSIALTTALAMGLLGLALPPALLLAAVLAPTDPVLASDVQVGRPDSGEEDDVRFALTSEAGLNDGLAFPFVHLAIALAGVTYASGAGWAVQWFALDVVWKLAAGVVLGWICGRVLGWLIFRLPNRTNLSRTGDGFVALGITCLTYGLTEMFHGYGFLAVFIAGLSLRRVERHHEYNQRLHDFAEQIERLLMMVLLVMFGGAIAGGMLGGLDWTAIVFAALLILLIRPLAGWIGMIGVRAPALERGIIAFYGIRGIGSAYYLAYAQNREAFGSPEYLWSIVGLVVLVSIVLHGITVTPTMRLMETTNNSAQKRQGIARLIGKVG